MTELPDIDKSAVDERPEEPSSGNMLSRMIEGILSIGLATMSAMTLGLITTMVVVRQLPPEDYGVYVLLVVSSTFVSEATSLGLSLAVPTFIAGTEDQWRRGDLITTAICFRLLTIALASVVVLVVRPAQLILPDSPSFGNTLVYLPLLFGLDGLGKTFKTVLQGLFRFKTISIINVLASVLNFLLVGVFVLLMQEGLTGLIHAKAISLAVSAGLALFFIPHRQAGTFRFSVLKRLLVFGFPLELQYILTFIFSRVDTFIIGSMLGPAGIAYYEVARRIPESLNDVYDAFRMVYFPFAARLFARNQRRELLKLLNHSIRVLSFMTMLGALIAFLFGNDIFTLLFSQKYLSSVPAFVILMIGLNLAFTEYTLGYSLVAIGQSDKPLYVNLVRTLTNIAINLLLIPVLGMAGAALANVISNLIAFPINLLFLSRQKIWLSVVDYVKPVGVFAACALIVLVLGPTHYLFRATILIVYLVGCVLLSVIKISEMSLVTEELLAIATRVTCKWHPGDSS